MSCGLVDTQKSPHAKFRATALRDVQLLPGFWKDRFETCREATLPYLDQLMDDPEMGHALTNLKIAAGMLEGEFKGTNWQDEWVYKWLEAAALVFLTTGDKALDTRMNEIIEIIAKAQEDDGFICTSTTVRKRDRWLSPHHHELYVMGHLMTAACVHHRVTGKDNFLSIAIRVADFLYQTFINKPAELMNIHNNPSNIMGAVELYRETGDKRYLDLAVVFTEMPGSVPGGDDRNQDRIPIRKEAQAIGHAVMATYLYTGAMDVVLETGEQELRDAMDRIWEDATTKKTFINGGIAAIHRSFSHRFNPEQGRHVPNSLIAEAFGDDYQLPNVSAYNETCAQIGGFMWSYRLLCATGEAKYADNMEHALYNSIMSGIGLEGKSWFYTNVLRHYGKEHRLLSADAYERFPPKLNHICCPSNLVRTVAGLQHYLYSLTDEGVALNIYGASRFEGVLKDGRKFAFEQDTRYPWDGEVQLTIKEAPQETVSIHLRIPEWAEGATVEVNGESLSGNPNPQTYFEVSRVWTAGDVLRMSLPMDARLVEGNWQIETVRNHIAVLRGPVVYCLESADLPEGVHVDEIYLDPAAEFLTKEEPELLEGVVTISTQARRIPRGEWTGLYRKMERLEPEPCDIRLIPYYAWANRGVSEMSIWLPILRK